MGSASNYVRVEVLTRGRTIVNDINDSLAHSIGPTPTASADSSTHNSSNDSDSSSSTDALGKQQPHSSTADLGSSLIEGEEPPVRRLLLCNIRGLLKKMQRSVLVGDKVGLVGIDWRQGRAIVEDVLPRRSELQDPAVANVDHLLLLFALDRPAVSAVMRQAESAEDVLPFPMLRQGV